MNSIIGYVNIKQTRLSKFNLSECEWIIPYGEFAFYKNEYGDYQLQAGGKLMILSKDFKNSICLYKGNMVYGGKATTFSKKRNEHQESKVLNYKQLQNEINKLQEERQRLLLR